MRRGHVASVRELPGLDDSAAIAFARHIFGKSGGEGYDGFEVWDLSRIVIQHPPPTPIVRPAPPTSKSHRHAG
jgi:hypothetical protein